jgi:hypothetical protein
MPPLSQILVQWHEFYSIIGEASATLVALIFVAASIGAEVFTSKQAGTRSFLSPTVVHFTTVLVICLLASIPNETWEVLGALLGGVGAIGLVYSGWVWRRMLKHGFVASIDTVDRLWYALLPIPAHLLVITAGLSLWRRSLVSLDLLASALILLLLIGIRNAWDMTVWVMDRRHQ